MNAHARHNAKGQQPVRKLAVDCVVVQEHFPEPLIGTEKTVYDAFLSLKLSAAKTSQITKEAGYSNEGFIRSHLWALVRNGYIAAYYKTNRWVWCDIATAERMIKSQPQLHVDYDCLTKCVSEDGTDIYEKPSQCQRSLK
jgi:hypothetical protein